MAWLWRQKKSASATLLAEPPAEGLEARTKQIGRELLAEARTGGAGLLSKKFWSDQLMTWAMKDEAFKIQLFQFIDVFPALKTPEQVHDHLYQYLDQPGVTLPAGLSTAMKAGGLLKGTLAKTITSQIEGMAAKFIAGRAAADSVETLQELWKRNTAFSVDLLGEACVSTAETEAYKQRYLDLIENLPGLTASWAANPQLERDHLGAVPRVNVSIKISAFDPRVRVTDPEGTITRLMATLRPLLESAKKNNVLVNFDMEQFELKDLTILLFQRCCEAVDFPAGLAMQAYLKSGEEDIRGMIDWAKRAKRQVTVRLIKGAYWDYETIHADMMGWESPVWERKHQTDACFERMARTLIKEMPRAAGEPGVKVALGTHNVRSMAWTMACLEEESLPQNAVEFQALRGMADELKKVLITRGWRLREYVPMGEMLPGMAYLVRRLLENTSNESWLRAGFADDADTEKLVASPHEASRGTGLPPGGMDHANRHALSVTSPDVAGGTPFFTEPLRDFADEEEREAFAKAIQGTKVPDAGAEWSIDQAKAGVTAAERAFGAWRDRPVTERSALIVKAAELMRRERDALSAIVVKESGKPWIEADGDVCEAIDFCEYYAREAVAIQTPKRLGRFAGELNEQWSEARGVAAVISPWNFPLAICAGMTVAALVTGNAVLVKPAEQTPGIARRLCEILWQAGIPKDVLQFVPGKGETVGAALVRDPRVALIAFTGSKAVGLDIVQAAGMTVPGQRAVKRVVCEMGGKNAIIVDTTADLDEAVIGVRQSAFGYAGQKCSACSRVIVLDDVYDHFVERLVEATKALSIGDPTLGATDVGPVIDEEAAKKINGYIERSAPGAKLALAIKTAGNAGGKPLVGPAIFVDVSADAAIACEEIFGPVLAVIRVSSFDEALRIANRSEYKLTGGVFTRSPRHLEQARREFRVGNLYLNRGCTGALVGRQPFGGAGMSGLGSKAGGADYLLHFVDPRVVTTNTLRRGFAAQIETPPETSSESRL